MRLSRHAKLWKTTAENALTTNPHRPARLNGGPAGAYHKAAMTTEPLFEVELYTHFFKLKKVSYRALRTVFKFADTLTQWTWVKDQGQKPSFKPTNLFGVKTRQNTEFRFHRSFFKAFIDKAAMDGMPSSCYTVKEFPLYQPTAICCPLKKHYVLRQYQETGVAHICSNSIQGHSRLIEFATGQGKTLTSLAACSIMGSRVAVMILPRYIEKWRKDVVDTLDCDPDRVMVVQGAGMLKALMQQAEASEADFDFVILSTDTMQSFYKLYETVGDELETLGYPFSPDKLWEKLGIGAVLVDETHQHINAVHRMMMYSHVPTLVALSATLLSVDPVVKKVHDAMYPRECRYQGEKMEQYIRLYPVEFNFKQYNPYHIRTTEFGSNNYSHNAFEKSIMKMHPVKKAYMDMVVWLLKRGYLDNYQSGDKAIVFASSIAMCTALTQYLKQAFPNKDVRRYVEDDPFDNIIEADIRVTTIGSGGTAIDIPMLTCAVQTVNVSSPVANLQALGRLRNLTSKGRTVKYYYTYCRQIPKQVKYHEDRMILFRERVASIKDIPYQTPLG